MDWVITVTLFVLGLSMALIVHRLLVGPATIDRVLALDTLATNFVAVLVVLSIWLKTDLYLEGALVISVLAFVGTVVISKYLMRGRIIE
jgi:multicomponent K+:H+ antiporter subunit F